MLASNLIDYISTNASSISNLFFLYSALINEKIISILVLSLLTDFTTRFYVT